MEEVAFARTIRVEAAELQLQADYTSAISSCYTSSPHHDNVDLSLFEDSVSCQPPPPFSSPSAALLTPLLHLTPPPRGYQEHSCRSCDTATATMGVYSPMRHHMQNIPNTQQVSQNSFVGSLSAILPFLSSSPRIAFPSSITSTWT